MAVSSNPDGFVGRDKVMGKTYRFDQPMRRRAYGALFRRQVYRCLSMHNGASVHGTFRCLLEL